MTHIISHEAFEGSKDSYEVRNSSRIWVGEGKLN